MPKPIFWEKSENIFNLLSAEFALIVVKVKNITTFVGHFVSFPREWEKRDRRSSRQGEEKEETGEDHGSILALAILLNAG